MSEVKDSEHRFYQVENDLYYVDKDDEIYKLDLKKEDTTEDCNCQSDDVIETKDLSNIINENEQDNSEDSESETLPSETVKEPGSFRVWCKSKGLMGKDGKVGDKCIEAGLNSDSKSIQAKAKLAKAFKTMRGKKDFTDDMLLDEIDGIVDDSNLSKNETNAIKNETKGESKTDFEMTQTSETKPDGSTAMMERRISQCMEQTKKSREQCAKEVKSKMKKQGSENTNTSDIKEEKEPEKKDMTKEEKEPEKEEEEEEEEPETEKPGEKKEKGDTVEVCAKEYDFLKSKYEELKTLKADKEKADKELDSFKKDFLAFKAKVDEKETKEKEAKRQEIVKRISNDFQIPVEELKNDSIQELEKLEKRFEMAIKRDTEDLIEPELKEEDFKSMADDMKKRYFLEA